MEIKILVDDIQKKIEECNERIEFFTFHSCFRLKELECVKKLAYFEISKEIEKHSNDKELPEILQLKSYVTHGDYKCLLEKGFISLAEEKYVAKSVYFEIINCLHSSAKVQERVNEE